jgi:hypothetical protein
MTMPTTPPPMAGAAPAAPAVQVSINDNLPTSSPSPRSTLIGFGCVVAVIALFVLYWKVIGF